MFILTIIAALIFLKMKKVKSYKRLGIVGIFTGILSLVLLSSSTINYFEINKQLDIFSNLFREVSLSYVDDTEPGDLMRDAIDHMLKELDPYTVYIPESDIENYRMMQTGQYGGVGASILKIDDYVVISAPRKGYPADKAGMKAGDRILRVEGKEMKGKSTEDVSGLLKGSPGTEVALTYGRGEKEITVTLKREEIQLKSVPYYGMLDDKTGYAILTSFTDKASSDIIAAIKDLKSKGTVEQMVLDLRGNPGGLLSEAVNVSNIFIDKGQTVVETKGRSKETNNVYRTLKKPLAVDMPLVVLINDRSASASEIVSGTIQDLDRGVVMGQRSYGKGLVQQTRPLSYGSQLKVTIAKYYTPSGRCIQAINYAERKADGSVVKMPDSLRTEFKTVNGRSVYDGGGVDPDVDLEPLTAPSVLISLLRNHLIFEYATMYAEKHAEIQPAGEFKLTENEYSDFVSFLDGKEYHYTTKTEKLFEQLKSTSESENYIELTKEIDHIALEFDDHKNEDLTRFKDVIKKVLEEEIVGRYYYDEGRIVQELGTDETIHAAVQLLNDKSRYQSLLVVNE